MKNTNNIQVTNLNIEEINLYVINELLNSISYLEIPLNFKNTLDNLIFDIENYLFPLPNSLRQKDAYNQKWTVTTFFSNK